MRVLIVPEDFVKDQYILKPLIERFLRSIDQGARIRVCQEPRLGGVDQALNSVRLREIVDRYEGMVDIFLLCVDRDGNANRRRRLDDIESEFSDGRTFIAENAWEEVETWALAGLNLPPQWRWRDVRAEVSVKEVYFERFARERGFENGPGGGRKRLGEEAARNIGAIRQKCREDFDRLARRIETELNNF